MLTLSDAKAVDSYASSRKHREVPAPLKLPDSSASFDTLREVLAFNIRTLRIGHQMSQEQLGFVAGLDRTFISQVERAKINVSLDNIEKLAISLDVDPYLLFVNPTERPDVASKAARR